MSIMKLDIFLENENEKNLMREISKVLHDGNFSSIGTISKIKRYRDAAKEMDLRHGEHRVAEYLDDLLKEKLEDVPGKIAVINSLITGLFKSLI